MESKKPLNENGFMRDIYHTTKNQYIETNEPSIFNNRREYSLILAVLCLTHCRATNIGILQ